MNVVEVPQPVVFTLPDNSSVVSSPLLVQPMGMEGAVIAQQFDQDILGDIQAGFENFVESGQVWALFIGLVIGYLIRSITAY